VIDVDLTSLLVHVRGDVSLQDLEQALARQGLTLDVSPLEGTVAEWIARGAPGSRDPLRDPVDQLMAGFTARMKDGRVLDVRPTPRRADGPDLSALVLGTERFATIERAWLRAHKKGTPRPQSARAAFPETPLDQGEQRLLDAIERALVEQGDPEIRRE
jgi:alkyldihydroxyacetonephosphate synthase